MNDRDQAANHEERAVLLSRLEGTALPERLWTYEDFTAVAERPSDFGPGLVSLAFIKAAIRRGRRFWCAMAVAGLLAGFGLHVAFPPDYQASTSVLLTFGPYENPATAALDDQVIAQSNAVAGLALHKLGLEQNVSSFAAAYTASAVSNRVLVITARAPSSSQAVSWANAAAAAFLQFRARQLETEQKLVLNALQQQVSQVRQRLNSVSSQISRLPAQPASPAQQAQLSKLQAERTQLSGDLYTREQGANGTQPEAATTLAVKGSVVLDTAAPLHHSRLRSLMLYPSAGLILGLVLGLAIVVVRALVSDRVHRRDDVARALGAPVKLTVDANGRSRWLPGGTRRRAAQDAEIRRVAQHIRGAARARFRGPAAVAVVPVGDPQVAALSVVSMAVACGSEGKQVVVADLCPDAPAARLLGVTEPGVRPAATGEGHIVAAVPDRGELAPIGLLGSAQASTQRSPFTEAVASACASADFLITLAAVDPARGADHLATWAADAVAVVTAGGSSAATVHAAGEMVRLAGMYLDSAVLVGADKIDESLGAITNADGCALIIDGNGYGTGAEHR